MISGAPTGHLTHGAENIARHVLKGKEDGQMEQMPQWLTDAVHAAGMTAFAEGLEPKTLTKHAPESRQFDDEYPPILPLH